MKRTTSRRLALAITTAALAMSLSATAFAAGPQEMSGQTPAGTEAQMPPAGAPQGQQQNEQQTPPADAPQGQQQNGQQTPPAGAPQGQQQNRPEMEDNGVDAILKTLSEMEDSDTKTNLQALMDAHRDAIDAERKAADETARKEASAAVDTARENLNKALKEAGLDLQMKAPSTDELAKKEETKPAADSEQTAVKPTAEGEQKASLPEDPQGLFQKFLQWLKSLGTKA